MGNNKQILATSTTVNCIPPNKMQRLASNCYTLPEGPECDAQQKSEQTAALPSIHLTFFSSLWFSNSLAICLSISIHSSYVCRAKILFFCLSLWVSATEQCGKSTTRRGRGLSSFRWMTNFWFICFDGGMTQNEKVKTRTRFLPVSYVCSYFAVCNKNLSHSFPLGCFPAGQSGIS